MKITNHNKTDEIHAKKVTRNADLNLLPKGSRHYIKHELFIQKATVNQFNAFKRIFTTLPKGNVVPRRRLIQTR